MKIKVLVVDDSRLTSVALDQYLAARGCQSDHVYNAEDALGRIPTYRPHGLVLDYRLPRMGGLELLALLRGREATRRLPVVVLTAVYGPEAERLAEAVAGLPPAVLMRKPAEAEAILQALLGMIKGEAAPPPGREGEP